MQQLYNEIERLAQDTGLLYKSVKCCKSFNKKPVKKKMKFLSSSQFPSSGG